MDCDMRRLCYRCVNCKCREKVFPGKTNGDCNKESPKGSQSTGEDATACSWQDKGKPQVILTHQIHLVLYVSHVSWRVSVTVLQHSDKMIVEDW